MDWWQVDRMVGRQEGEGGPSYPRAMYERLTQGFQARQEGEEGLGVRVGRETRVEDIAARLVAHLETRTRPDTNS